MEAIYIYYVSNSIVKRATLGSSGVDLRLEGPRKILYPGETAMLLTGLRVCIPEGYEGQVRGRSSLSRKGLLVHTGTIDSDYRGEVGVIVTNVGTVDILLEPGERIAQLVSTPIAKALLCKVDSLEPTERGEGGFGSTGRF